MERISGHRPKGDIRSLTGMRGVAALAIVFTHYQIVATVKAYLAVDLFFTLSGFVMALTYSRAFIEQPGGKTYADFLWKRFARVYPLYALVTMATFILPIPGIPTTPLQLAINLLLIQQFALDYIRPDLSLSIVGPGWSISAELAAYLLFPIVVNLCLTRRWFFAAIVAVVSAATIIGMSLMPFDYSWQIAVLDRHFRWEGVARCLTEFSFGVIAYRAWRGGAMLPVWAGSALTIAIVVVSRFFYGDPFVVLCFPFLILGAVNPADPIYRALGARPVHYLGELSYALYLIHIQPYFYIRPYTDWITFGLHLPHARAVSLLMLIGVDLVLAALALRFVEKPSRYYLRHLFSKRPVGPLVAEPAAP